ncbi:MAG: RsmG family class I SAM-dependent methyltransferase [Balneolaceae bacterium]
MTHDVSRETLLSAQALAKKHDEKIQEYIDQLFWWNDRLNLMSRSVSRETVEEHVIHSLLPEAMGMLDMAHTWVDAGTGGGLPGIPLAIVAPVKTWILNDRSEKKMIAVKQIVQSLGLDQVEIRSGSIESIKWPEYCGVISKHAFPVTRLLSLIQDKPWGRLILYKGVTEPDVDEAMQGLEGFQTRLDRFMFDHEPFFDKKGMLSLDRSG